MDADIFKPALNIKKLDLKLDLYKINIYLYKIGTILISIIQGF